MHTLALRIVNLMHHFSLWCDYSAWRGSFAISVIHQNNYTTKPYILFLVSWGIKWYIGRDCTGWCFPPWNRNKEHNFRSDNNLKYMDVRDYLLNFDPSLLCLLDGLNYEEETMMTIGKQNLHNIYSIYLTQVLSFFCFVQNLLMFNTTHSKQVVNLLEDSGPCGHRDAVRL